MGYLNPNSNWFQRSARTEKQAPALPSRTSRQALRLDVRPDPVGKSHGATAVTSE